MSTGGGATDKRVSDGETADGTRSTAVFGQCGLEQCAIIQFPMRIRHKSCCRVRIFKDSQRHTRDAIEAV